MHAQNRDLSANSERSNYYTPSNKLAQNRPTSEYSAINMERNTALHTLLMRTAESMLSKRLV